MSIRFLGENDILDSSHVTMTGSPEYTFKLLLIGNSGTGKSAFLLRFTDDVFEGEGRHEVTVGVDFKMKLLEYSSPKSDQEAKPVKYIKLNLWDTAGQERFRTLTSSYYRGAHGVILMYDITDQESFDNLDSWFKEIKTYAPDPPAKWIVMVIGNKVDKESERVVSIEQGLEYSRREGALFLECSSKSNLNVQKAFSEMVLKIMENIDLVYDVGGAGGENGQHIKLQASTGVLGDYCSC